MSYTPFVVNRFGGLDLIDDPQEVGPERATDLLNTDFDKRGILRARDGWSLLTSSAVASNFQAMGMFVTSGGTEYLVASDSGTLRPYQSNGTAGTTQAGAATSNNSFARFGTPVNTRLYVAAGGSYYRFDGATWTAVAAPPISPNLLAVTANDNRMAIATGTLDAKVHFSDAGDPETFGANNYVTLWPGDGEGITGLVRWRDMVFAFKRSRFAVFYGTSTDGTGNPIFNYRSVDAGVGCLQQGAAVAGEDGVYFATLTGLYRTTGGDPVLVSKPVEPWLHRDVTVPAVISGNPTLAYHRGRVYVNYPSAGVQGVYDTQTGEWTAWNLAATSLLGVPSGMISFSEGLYLGDSVSKKLGYVTSLASTDNGTAITWRYQSGFYEVGDPGKDAYIRNTRLWGIGQPTVSVLTDHGTTDAGASAVTLSATTVPAQGYHAQAYKGQLFSHKLSGTAGAWSVDRLQHDVAWVRP